MSNDITLNEIKKSKLRELVNSVLRHPLYRVQLTELKNKLGLTESEIIQGFLDYNMDIFAFDNEVYDSVVNRYVLHVHNLLEGSCHQDKQKTIIDLLAQIKPKNVVDIGFGVPSRYVQKLVLESHAFKLTLCDLYDMAFQFASALLNQWDPAWQKIISFKQADMKDVHLIGEYDTYLFQESIEHVQDPTACLKDYVKLSPHDAKFILYLPINAPIPAHFIVWEDDNAAELWLESCGLKIEKKIYIRPNKKVDLFAESLDIDHRNIVFLCSKRH